METKYYTICQNNVEGRYKRNDEIDIYISVEAHCVEDARLRLHSICGCWDDYCPCCGNRFKSEIDNLSEEDGHSIPMVHGEDYTDVKDKFWLQGNPKIKIYKIDKTLVTYSLKERKVIGEDNYEI